MPKYCESVYTAERRPTRTVKVWEHIFHVLPARTVGLACLYRSAQLFGNPQKAEWHVCSASLRTIYLQIGNVNVGSEHPIALQTMTTTDTRDVDGTVEQVKRCADAGANLVRLTVQGKKEAEACFKIRERLFKVKDCILCACSSFQGLNSHSLTHELPSVKMIHTLPSTAGWL